MSKEKPARDSKAGFSFDFRHIFRKFVRKKSMEMKKTAIITLIFILSALGTAAQPRALGGRIGATGFDISYQHTFGKKNFLQTDASLDFGYAGNGAPGFKATALYNFTIARPAWTQRGSWAMYTGPGISLGYVQDRVMYKDGSYRYHPLDYGFMLAFAAQFGLEYTFWFPLQISVDIRPYFGMHVNDGISRRVDDITDQVVFKSKTGWYNNGWYGFIPTLSFRYRF